MLPSARVHEYIMKKQHASDYGDIPLFLEVEIEAGHYCRLPSYIRLIISFLLS